MRVLQIGSDRSKRGELVPGTPATLRQQAYAKRFGELIILDFSLRRDGFRSYVQDGVTTYPTNSFSKLWYGLDAIRIAKTFPKPDVVSAQDPFEVGLVAWIIARRLSVPLHVQVHTDFLSPGYARHSLHNKVRMLFAGFIIRRASRIRVVSEKIKQQIETIYNPLAPIAVLPIFTYLDRFKHATVTPAVQEKFSRYVTKLLVVARLEPEKNVELAIRAFYGASPHNAEACLIIVGEGSAGERLKALARATQASDRIYFEGAQDPAPYYALADLVLVPSRYEGYGLVIIEALAAGVPVLSTDVGVAREAGAIISSEKDFADDLKKWFENGPREAHLTNYPYQNFDEYVRAYCEDIAASEKIKK